MRSPVSERLLRRNKRNFWAGLTRKIVVNYDGDSAGVKAARRAIETLCGRLRD